jgi:hypothetical protein
MPVQVSMRGILESDMKIVLNDKAAWGFFIEKNGSLYEVDLCLLKITMPSKNDKSGSMYSSCYSDAMDDLQGSGFDLVTGYVTDEKQGIIAGDLEEYNRSLQEPLVKVLKEKVSHTGERSVIS